MYTILALYWILKVQGLSEKINFGQKMLKWQSQSFPTRILILISFPIQILIVILEYLLFL